MRHARLLPRPDRPDGELLAAFAADRDEAAFAELVRRHGRLVWAACRRHLPDAADAEDAFQATFLVLVRRADHWTACRTVGPWLHRVATLTARDLRRRNARRFARVRPLPADVPAPPPVPDLDLDAALLALPERYRSAVALCYLEGLTQRAAAARLGCPEKTLSSRVARGLAKLRSKLARDPLPLVVPAVPAGLLSSTARAAAAFAAASAAPSAGVFRLVEGVIRMFWVKKLSAAGVAGALMLAAGFGLGVGTRHAPATAADGPLEKRAAPADEHQSRLDAAKAAEAVARIELEQAQARVAVARKGVEAAEAALKRATPARVEVIVNGAADRPPFAVIEPNADGDAELSTSATTAAALRRHLARVKADPQGPKELHVTIARQAKAENVRAALAAAKAAGFAGGRVTRHPQAIVVLAAPNRAIVTRLDHGFVVDDYAAVTVIANPDLETSRRSVRLAAGRSTVIPVAFPVESYVADDKLFQLKVEPDKKGVRVTGVAAGSGFVIVSGAGGKEEWILLTVEAGRE